MRNWIRLFETVQFPPPLIHHGSSLRALLRIHYLNCLTPGADDADQEGTFCSADPKVAARYTEDHMYSSPAGGVITLDSASLIAAGNTISSYFYHSGDDGEEWVIQSPNGGDVKNIDQHIRAINFVPGALDQFKKDAMCCYTEDEWDTAEEYVNAVNAFVKQFG